MATIHLTATEIWGGPGGPEVPSPIGCILREREWPGGGTVPVLVMSVGTDCVEIWPADPVILDDLASRLKYLAGKLREKT